MTLPAWGRHAGLRHGFLDRAESAAGSGDWEENCFRTIHAEINAIAQAARHGVGIREAAIYITHTPCIHCFKVLINTGITRICYEKPYKLDTIEELRCYAPQVELVAVAPASQ